MASPPPFVVFRDDPDGGGDFVEPATADRHHPAASPTGNGLNDRRLRLTRSRRDPNPSPNAPPAQAAAAAAAYAISPTSPTPPSKRRRSTWRGDDHGDGDNVLGDLTNRLHSLSVHKLLNPTARPRGQHRTPLKCGITADADDQSAEDGDAHADDASAPLRISASDDGPGQGKENRGAVENDAEDVEWVKEEDFEMEPTGTAATYKPYKLPGRIFRMLYPHQREGLRWLWFLHCKGTGGILGDDMGLGKTMQVSAFLAGLFHSRLIKRVLIVAPKTLLAHWIKELSVVGLQHKIRDYSGLSVKLRSSELQCAFKEGGVLLTTYDIVRTNYKLIRGDSYSNDDGHEEGTLWNYVILDEGHLIKNIKTQRAQSLFEIPCNHRIVISGTPIQNNLKEMWALFNFCCPDVLGDKKQFKTSYEMAILRGNDKNATARDKHVGSNVAKVLRERIKPYFLRRMKSEVFLDSSASEEKMLPKKNELIVWLKLTACQRKLYEAFLNSELVHLAVQPKGSPLAAITMLKKICDHPLLLTKKAAEGVLEGMDQMLNDQDIGMVEKMAMNLADISHDDEALEVGQDVSCKLSFIMSLLRNLVKEGHHVLIFSQTCKMLNLIQEAILLEGYKFLRIDGATKVSERERIVEDFQEGPGAPIFLLTTQVGGLGLTLTKAARVIVVDPAWNPSTDNQSVDRAYRIGQTKDVIVYRLMTSATIEEKIYKLQVFKGALFRTATEQKEQTRYFSKSEIRELFSLPQQGFDVSLTQQQLQEEHGQQVVMDVSLRQHIQFLEQQGIAGVSHHSLLFSKTAILPTLSEDDALDSKPGGVPMMPQHYYKGSSSDYVASGDESLRHHIQFQEQQGIAGVSHHSLLFSKTAILPTFSENDALASKPRGAPMMPQHYYKGSSSDYVTSRYCPSNRSAESTEEIRTRTFSNTALVSKLPESGELIRRQISESDEKLTYVEDENGATEIITLDDLLDDLPAGLRFMDLLDLQLQGKLV